MFDIVGRRRHYFAASLLLIVLSLAAVASWGLRLGVDFTGGSVLEIRLPQAAQTPRTPEARSTGGPPPPRRPAR